MLAHVSRNRRLARRAPLQCVAFFDLVRRQTVIDGFFLTKRILPTSRLKRGTHVQIDAFHGKDIPRRTRTPHDVSCMPKVPTPPKTKTHG
eukprot:COSAG02_NODE_57694_length_279_cov_14.294444_1_plen_89_part_10